jgi:hypothetical protein
MFAPCSFYFVFTSQLFEFFGALTEYVMMKFFVISLILCIFDVSHTKVYKCKKLLPAKQMQMSINICEILPLC